MKYSIFFLFALLLFSGCNQSENKSVKMINDTYHTVPTGYTYSVAKMRDAREEREQNYRKEMDLAKLKSQENLQLAKIEAEGKKEIKQIESEAMKTKVSAEKEMHHESQNTQKEIAAAKEIAAIQTQEKDLFLYQIIIAVSGVLVLLILLVYYLIHRHNKSIEMKLHEEKLKHEVLMQDSAQQHEKMGRVLDIIADEEANEHVRHALIGILKEQTISQNLITYEPEVEVEVEEEVTVDVEDKEVSKNSSG
ncbi:MAG: hypothetical protein DRG30_03710 [Epsilonproteobacteria bacterium]|nr:MAG: hypothetical protein DRG30_03710 [Campylobacterota bacterium]